MTTTSGETLTDETRLTVLETRMEAVQEGQRQILARLDAMQQNTDARFEAAIIPVHATKYRRPL